MNINSIIGIEYIEYTVYTYLQTKTFVYPFDCLRNISQQKLFLRGI